MKITEGRPDFDRLTQKGYHLLAASEPGFSVLKFRCLQHHRVNEDLLDKFINEANARGQISSAYGPEHFTAIPLKYFHGTPELEQGYREDLTEFLDANLAIIHDKRILIDFYITHGQAPAWLVDTTKDVFIEHDKINGFIDELILHVYKPKPSSICIAQRTGLPHSDVIGHAFPARTKNGIIENLDRIAEQFSVDHQKLLKAVQRIEESEHPEIILLQNTRPDSGIASAAIYSSVWSRSYKFSNNIVWRDYYYQVIFSAIAALVETGCNVAHVENPRSGYLWDTAAYICLQEACNNIRRTISTNLKLMVSEFSYIPTMPTIIDPALTNSVLNEHSPIGTQFYIYESLNMRKVFVEMDGRAILK